MNAEFVITPMQIWQAILIICGGIITIGGALAIVNKWIKRVKKPSTDIKNDIEEIKKTIDNHEDYFKNDKEDIEEIKKGQQIMFKSHLALISHALDGNDIEQLKSVKGELQSFLIVKK